MEFYPFDSIQINGSKVFIEHIMSGAARPSTPFETETFAFIKAWLGEEKIFNVETSGSTGEPKKIEFSREQLVASAEASIQALSLKKNDTALVCIHTKYIGGKMMLVRALLHSMKIICVEPSANPLQSISQKEKIDFMALVPLQLKALLDAGLSTTLNSMSTIIVGGASVDEDLISKVQKELTTPIYATFGMTETLSHVALRKLNKIPSDDLYHTLPEIKIRSDDEGCLIIEAPYLKGEIHTNDICEIHSATTFTWMGRRDDVINTGGIKIYPAKVEAKIKEVLNGLNIHRRLILIGKPDSHLGKKVILAIEGSSVAEAPLMEAFRFSLEKYELPKQIIFVPSFEMTENSKINRFRIANSLNFDG